MPRKLKNISVLEISLLFGERPAVQAAVPLLIKSDGLTPAELEAGLKAITRELSEVRALLKEDEPEPKPRPRHRCSEWCGCTDRWNDAVERHAGSSDRHYENVESERAFRSAQERRGFRSIF